MTAEEVVAVLHDYENSIAYLIPGAEAKATYMATGNEVGAFRTFFHTIPGWSMRVFTPAVQGRVPYLVPNPLPRQALAMSMHAPDASPRELDPHI